MAVHVDGLRLWQGQESTAAVEAGVDTTSVPGQPPDETLIVSLEAVESLTVGGLATGIRLTGESGYSTDPQTALAQWLQQFETLVWPAQGEGWSLVDDERDRTITVTVTGASWTFSYGDPVAARYSLDVTRGEGVLTSSARDPSTPGDTTGTPNSSATLDGNDLGTVSEKRTELALAVEAEPIALQGTDATVITPESGVLRRWTLTGRRTDTDANLRSFDANLRALNGSNQTVTYATGMPGTTHEVAVRTYDSTYRAGETASLSYAATLVEGQAI